MKDEINYLGNHQWAGDGSHEIKIDGRPLILRRCAHCGRDFGGEADGADWKAVHVAPFKVEFLDEEKSHRWVSEVCPGISSEGEHAD